MREYIIHRNATILDALKQIDSISDNGARTLFVQDTQQRIIGTVTDGDCRRGLIKGYSISDSISSVMNNNFTFLEKGKYDVNIIKKIKKIGLRYVPELNVDGTLFQIRNFSSGRSYIPVDAVLMAGGKGERLRPLTLTTPKPLLKIGDKPIIDYNIMNLLHTGITHINITVNYLKEQIISHFISPIEGVQINCIREPSFLGTIGSIQYIKEWHNDTILLMNSDLFTNINLQDFYLHFLEHQADMSVAAIPYTVSIPYGIFEISETRKITSINEKPSYYYYANAGIYLIKRSMLNKIPQNTFFNATDFIHKLISSNNTVIRFPLSGYWIDIGKPEDYHKAQEFANHLQKEEK